MILSIKIINYECKVCNYLNYQCETETHHATSIDSRDHVSRGCHAPVPLLSSPYQKKHHQRPILCNFIPFLCPGHGYNQSNYVYHGNSSIGNAYFQFSFLFIEISFCIQQSQKFNHASAFNFPRITIN